MLYYDLDSLQRAYLNGEKLEYVFFWGNIPPKDGSIKKSCLSQWWDSSFYVDGNNYCSAEQWMMAGKARLFKDFIILEKILQSKSPAQVKQYGREIQNFNHKEWDMNRIEIVFNGNYYKFSQNKNLMNYLISTESKILVEASPKDKIWGIGLGEEDNNANFPTNWNGLNLLGFTLMKVRDKIREEL